MDMGKYERLQGKIHSCSVHDHDRTDHVLTNPIFGRKIVDTFIYNDNVAENLVSGRRLLIMLCLGMVVFTLVRTVIQFSSNMLYEVCSQGMLSKIRNYLFANVQKQDMTFTTAAAPAI